MTDRIPTWQECAAAGMTQADAARARGMTRAAACNAAKRLVLTFADGWRDERAITRLRSANHWQLRWAVWIATACGHENDDHADDSDQHDRHRSVAHHRIAASHEALRLRRTSSVPITIDARPSSVAAMTTVEAPVAGSSYTGGVVTVGTVGLGGTETGALGTGGVVTATVVLAC
jgi:hypothetical protein